MLRNYITVALRNLQRSVVHSTIIVGSLSIGIAACLVILLFVRDELTFDSFHTKKDNIYRLVDRQRMGDGSFENVALTGPPFAFGLQSEFPEIQSFTRVEEMSKVPLKIGDRQLFTEKKMLWVDSTFFEVFDFQLLYGDRNTLLDDPNSIVLTRSAALKFFDDPAEAIGKQILRGDSKDPHVITAIAEDVPENSHIQFDALIAMSRYTRVHPEYNTDWTGNYLYTYLLLYPNTDYKALEAKFPPWLSRWTESPDVNEGFILYLQRLYEVHLASSDLTHDYVNHRKFSEQHLVIIGSVGIFILLIACINFMNLTTARSSYRWKEIGVRKSIGAQKSQLFRQFVTESVLLAVMSLVIALLIDVVSLPMINRWIGRELKITDLNLPVITLATIGIGVLAAFYPAIIMSSVKAIRALKGKQAQTGKPVFQSTLVVVQFGLAIGLIIGALVVSKQLDFMKNTNLGFNKDQVVGVWIDDDAETKFDFLKAEIAKIPSVSGVTASSHRLGNPLHQTVFHARNGKEVRSTFAPSINVDFDYFEVYDIPLLQGRAFSKELTTDPGKAFIINRAMMKELGLTDPIGVQAGYSEEMQGTIVGVVDDFKYNSLHHKVGSLAIACRSDWGLNEMSIRIKAGSEQQVIESIRDLWSKTVQDYPFSYYFLEDHFESIYRNDEHLNASVSILTVLSILISCMGLFGLAALITVRRTREIGIRKVLGASELQILSLLSKNFLLLIVVSFVLVVPVSYYMASSWLENFAYRIDIDPFLFVIGGLSALAAGFFTVSYHTLKTAKANPVESLKHE